MTITAPQFKFLPTDLNSCEIDSITHEKLMVFALIVATPGPHLIFL